MQDLRSVELLGVVVPCAEAEGPRRVRRLYLALRPLIGGLGLSWKPQFLKVKACPAFAGELRQVRMMAQDSKWRLMVALPERLTFRWLSEVADGNLAEVHRRRLRPFQELLMEPEEADAERTLLAARRFFFDDGFGRVPVTPTEHATVSPHLDARKPRSSAAERANGVLQTFLSYHRRRDELRKELEVACRGTSCSSQVLEDAATPSAP